MPDFGLNAKGFKRKTYPDILESMQAQARVVFGEDVNLSERSPLGLFIRSEAWELAKLWEVAEDVYYSGYIDDAEGKQLDGVTKYATVTRKGAQKAAEEIIITGDPGTRVPKGFRIETRTGVAFATTRDSVIGDSGEVVADIEAVEPGQHGNVPANTITEIINPIAGVEAATNLAPTEGGADTENDLEYRERYYRSLSTGGSSTRAAVEAALLNMPSVKDAVVEENDTMDMVDDLPPKCIAPFVFGGDDTEVAKTILNAKAGGIRSYGATEVQTEDNRGYTHTIGFTRPVHKDIYVQLHLTKGVEYPVNGDELIKTEVVKYIGGIDGNNTEHKGLGLGQNVVHSKLVYVVGAVKGVNDVVVELSTDGETYSQSNIYISKLEIATISPDKVVIV